MIFLMMAAHDTSTITTAAVAYFLAKNPEWQDRLRAESDRLGDDLSDIEDLEGLTAMDLVIKESLRLVAPVPLVMRKTVTDTLIDGYYVPSGVLVVITPAVNHFAPTVSTEPDRIDPTRLKPPRREDQAHRFAWLPFGGGAHKRIGMHFGTLEVKAILHEMLREFTWSLDDGYRVRWDNTSLPVPCRRPTYYVVSPMISRSFHETFECLAEHIALTGRRRNRRSPPSGLGDPQQTPANRSRQTYANCRKGWSC